MFKYKCKYYIYIYIYIYIGYGFVRFGLVLWHINHCKISREFASGPGHRGSIPGRVIPNT